METSRGWGYEIKVPFVGRETTHCTFCLTSLLAECMIEDKRVLKNVKENTVNYTTRLFGSPAL